MKTIWKFDLSGTRELEMPEGATILSVDVQFGRICIWALVEPTAPKEKRVFCIYGTGAAIADNLGKFIGTVQLAGGEFIVHVFEINR